MLPRLLAIAVCWLMLLPGCVARLPRPLATHFPDRDPGVRSVFDADDAYVYASVNGHAPERFYFDSGAGINSITPEAAARFGLAPAGSVRIKDSNHEVRTRAWFEAASLDLGPVVLSRVPFSVGDVPELMTEDGVVGVIGLNGLAAFTVDVDYVGQTFAITQERLDATSAFVHPMRFDRYGIPLMRLTLADRDTGKPREIWATVDTGSSVALRLDRASTRRHTLPDPSLRGDVVSGAHGTRRVSAVAWLPGVRLGATELRALVADVNERHNLVGKEVLSAFRVRFDGPAGLIALSRPDDRPVVSVRTLGLRGLVRDGDECRVAWVVPGSPADRAGVRPGDAVLAVSGVPVGALATPERFWPLDRDNALTLLLRSPAQDGHERAVRVELPSVVPRV